MTDLADFLLARIVEDEAVAREATVRPYDFLSFAAHVLSSERDSTPAMDEHVDRWEPTRVLAECESKQRMVAQYLGAVAARRKMTDPIQQFIGDTIVETCEDFLRLLALPYADHPDYRQEWKP